MTQNKAELFERALVYPDVDFQERLRSLVGIDDQKYALIKSLALLTNPTGLIAWANRHHPEAKDTIQSILRRPPLIVLAGDVGSGKSELASTVGDAVARQENIQITLLPLSLSSRGQGRVGEMTQLLSEAFEYTISEANKLKNTGGGFKGALILLVDEADALAQSRESSQMHHEDKAGVNAFIRGIDRVGNSRLPVAVIMCTNRISALDPAIRRRASLILNFHRPNLAQRYEVLRRALSGLGLSDFELNKIAEITGPGEGEKFGFTYSDLVQRLVPAIVLDAYPNQSVSFEKAQAVLKRVRPTRPFNENLI